MEDVAGLEEFDQLGMMADIVSAYVSNNNVSVADLPELIASTHAALAELAAGSAGASDGGPDKATPAQIKKSITPDLLISFEDGKPYKTLRRHLTLRGLTPEAYRAKWGLPGDYPMTSANYSAHRSQLARDLGLGQQRRKSYARTATVAETVSDAPKGASKAADKTADKGAEKSAARASKPDAVEDGKVDTKAAETSTVESTAAEAKSAKPKVSRAKAKKPAEAVAAE